MTILSDFLDGAGNRQYRDLIQHHIRKQSFKQLGQGLLGTVTLLPENWEPCVADYIDRINETLGYDQEFWQRATVADALDSILGGIAPFVFPIEDASNFHQRVLRGEDAELAFNIFQIATLNFAASAFQKPALRKFMGIKKGWFS